MRGGGCRSAQVTESTWVSGLESLGPDDNPAAATPEVRIGPYRLLEKLGEGGMGTVWVAEQTEPVRRRVALKVIKAGMDSEQILQRFEAERQALALMDHRNIATVLDAGTSDAGLPYFVMELVKGVPITTYCDERKAPVRERLKLFGAVCHAIQHAHQKGIIHRDIKPANVLVSTQDGEPVPKVIDFGVAKALHQRLTDRPMYTEIGALVGTLEYMSPEQAELEHPGHRHAGRRLRAGRAALRAPRRARRRSTRSGCGAPRCRRRSVSSARRTRRSPARV